MGGNGFQLHSVAQDIYKVSSLAKSQAQENRKHFGEAKWSVGHRGPTYDLLNSPNPLLILTAFSVRQILKTLVVLLGILKNTHVWHMNVPAGSHTFLKNLLTFISFIFPHTEI